MHILATTSASIDDLVEPVDLAQTPGDMVVLSFTDSDLAALAGAWRAECGQAGGAALPSLRLASLRDLRHPMSVDLWLDKVGAQAKVIVLRLLGGLDWWRYGAERLAELARMRGIALAVLPGEDRDDPRLAGLSTVPPDEAAEWLACFRHGGRDNMRLLLRRMANRAGGAFHVAPAAPLPLAGFYRPGAGLVGEPENLADIAASGGCVPILFYRSMLLAEDLAPIDALAEALAERGLRPVPLMVASLKNAECAAFVRAALSRLGPAAVVTTTAFAIGADDLADDPFAGCDAPLLQAIVATTQREAWQGSPRGLAAADLAMHVVLPELDGRVLAGALGFKDRAALSAELCHAGLANRAEPDRVAAVAERVAALVRLRRLSRAERRLALVLPDYPGAEGRTGYAVGLDVPRSILDLLALLRDAGYSVTDIPGTARGLLDGLRSEPALSLADYISLLAAEPAETVAVIRAAWGEPADDPAVADGAFRFRFLRCGRAIVALPPDRGLSTNRRADYHDPALPPRHALLAFGLWLRREGVAALVHMGAHGTFEWLPGKAVALDRTSFPERVLGPLPVVYPFIVSNPGEAAQAKRRIGAVTLGHLPAPSVAAHLTGPLGELERLVDEYAQADGLDRRRRERLAQLIAARARDAGLAREAGLDAACEADEALRRIDAYLCDLKDLAVKDGLHVYGAGACGAEERAGLLAALDGRRVAPGPAGAPARGRTDVLPSGRNLYASDPRVLPTSTACDLAALAVDEIVRSFRQENGDWPRRLMLDVWGSATLRTGGEEIAQGLLLMGCRPRWDTATGRVTGIEVMPPAMLGRPRVDVTWRISGLFRDLFPLQVSLIDAAVRAVAARVGEGDDNPLVEAGEGEAPQRIFGTAPGAYGAGIEAMLATGAWASRDDLGRAYLEAASHAYGGPDGAGREAAAGFAARIASAEGLVHISDDPGRDLLEGSADAAFVGGFFAAARALGQEPSLLMLDTARAEAPRVRPLDQALARIVRARVLDPRFIAGQMRHGPRGAAEFAETIDRLIAFAETTGAVSSQLIDLAHDAYLGDESVRAFLLAESPEAAAAIARRFADARRRGLWHPRRNDIDATLHELAEAGR